MKAFHKNPIGLIWIWIFTYPHQLFNQTISYFIFLLILQIFFHLTANGYEGFKLTISPFNKSLFLPSKLLSLLNFINFCLYSSVLPSLLKIRPSFFVFLLRSFSFLVFSYASSLMIVFLLPSRFCGMCDPITSTSTSLNKNGWNPYFPISIHATQILDDSMTSREKLGCIVGFWNHSHLVRNLPLRE